MVKDPSFAFYGQLEGLSRLTPIMRYKNETVVPWELKDMIMENTQHVHFLTKRELGRWDRRIDEARSRVEMDRRAKSTLFGKIIPEQHEHHVRSNTSGVRPTQPPLTLPCDDEIPCFDLCCIVRAILQYWAFLFSSFGRIWTSLIQAGSSDFSYWTEGGFEADLTLFIRIYSEIWVCICNVLNLVIPVTQFNVSHPFFFPYSISSKDQSPFFLFLTIIFFTKK